MFHLFTKYRTSNLGIFLSAFTVFLILNMIENYIHYNIGRSHSESGEFIQFKSPNLLEWRNIILVMLLFGVLQGIFTLFVENVMDRTS